ncbi:hypothetical protein OH77DRAFT_160181 [Trametes cingulata]|nr:hypothetical protein OH77DRAFT_160181 [Trametes cingulata]
MEVRNKVGGSRRERGLSKRLESPFWESLLLSLREQSSDRLRREPVSEALTVVLPVSASLNPRPEVCRKRAKVETEAVHCDMHVGGSLRRRNALLPHCVSEKAARPGVGQDKYPIVVQARAPPLRFNMMAGYIAGRMVVS